MYELTSSYWMLQQPTIITSNDQKVLVYSSVEDQISYLAFYSLSESKLLAKIKGAELLIASYYQSESGKTYIHYIEDENVVLRPIDLSSS